MSRLSTPALPRFSEALRFWIKLGFIALWRFKLGLLPVITLAAAGLASNALGY